MYTFRSKTLLVLIMMLAVALASVTVQAQQQWERLPATPTLPTPVRSGPMNVNGIRLWFAVYGRGSPVILLH